jgi:ubiquinone/menaquinone biosynthesis C-methylase UbiE
MPSGHADAPLLSRVVTHYDDVMFDAYRATVRQEGDGFCNFGYWEAGTRSIAQAHANLMERLLAFLSRRDGRLLDVACGKGASTAYAGRYFSPARITGINVSDRQLLACRRTAPRSQFVKMDAAHLGFTDESFDNVLCVEAAFHFDSRERFLREAFRVLRRNGRLAVSDILQDREHLAPANPATRTIAGYLTCLERIGFRGCRIVDVTTESTDAYCDHADRCDRIHLPVDSYLAEFKPRTDYLRATCRPYVLVFAAKE